MTFTQVDWFIAVVLFENGDERSSVVAAELIVYREALRCFPGQQAPFGSARARTLWHATIVANVPAGEFTLRRRLSRNVNLSFRTDLAVGMT